MRFETGQVALRRYLLHDGRIGRVDCGRVLSDDRDGLTLWVHPGSECANRFTLDGRSIRKFSLDQKLRAATVHRLRPWSGPGVLQRTPADGGFSVWWFFAENGDFRLWYVNLETPARRWEGGVDTVDQELDVVIHPDLSWEWKDEDEFAERVDVPGFWTAAEAAEIRATGEKAVAMAQAGEPPFDGRLCDFAPDPAWGPSRLPWWWDRPPETGGVRSPVR